ERALKTLRHAVRTFAFGDRITISETFLIDGKSVKINVVNLAQPPGKDESAFLVALLTAVCRPSLWVAPAVIVKSPSISGSGVGKFCSCAVCRSPPTASSRMRRQSAGATNLKKVWSPH